MNTTSLLLLSGAVIVSGHWARGESISPKIVIAIVFLALMVGILGEIDQDIANAFTVLILIAVVLGNGG